MVVITVAKKAMSADLHAPILMDQVALGLAGNAMNPMVLANLFNATIIK